jgi:hypothetical protein
MGCIVSGVIVVVSQKTTPIVLLCFPLLTVAAGSFPFGKGRKRLASTIERYHRGDYQV